MRYPSCMRVLVTYWLRTFFRRCFWKFGNLSSPKGMRRPAQGCCTRLPWERSRASEPTPTGLWPIVFTYIAKSNLLEAPAATPLGLERFIAVFPR